MFGARNVRRVAAKKRLKIQKGSRFMALRYIELLPDITVMTLEGDKPYYVDKDQKAQPLTHRKYIKGRCTDAAFTQKGFAGSVAASDIISAMKDLGPGDILKIEDEDWQILKEAVEHPKVQLTDGSVVAAGFDGVAGPQIISFGRAVLDAKVEDPRKKPEAPSEEEKPTKADKKKS